MYGGELLTHPDHGFAASVRSAGYGYTTGRTIFSAYLPAAVADATARSAGQPPSSSSKSRPTATPRPA